jgi:hypothetical protein
VRDLPEARVERTRVVGDVVVNPLGALVSVEEHERLVRIERDATLLVVNQAESVCLVDKLRRSLDLEP